ncbi:hypothetical protein [Nonomuraea sp. NPDC052265]|uniref:hypothetical protein n=1 Tax=Nonomuraea sp. NPDC052265 TaxID=3364374 RepID=UPI0037C54130
MAEAIVRILLVRGIHVPDEAAELLLQCPDPDLLTPWIDWAVTTGNVDELLN